MEIGVADAAEEDFDLHVVFGLDRAAGSSWRQAAMSHWQRNKLSLCTWILLLLFPFDPQSGLVLFVADLFHPVDDLAVELFLNGDVRHGRGRRGAMPVLLAGREPDHIAGPDLLDRSALALSPAAAGRHDQGLTERMRMPCGPRARLEGDAGALNTVPDRAPEKADRSVPCR